MSIDLKEVRDYIKKECRKSSSCEGCKFNGFRLVICDMHIISDVELEKLEEIMRRRDV